MYVILLDMYDVCSKLQYTYLMLWVEYKMGMGQAELTFIKFNATARNVRILAQFDSWI